MAMLDVDLNSLRSSDSTLLHILAVCRLPHATLSASNAIVRVYPGILTFAFITYKLTGVI